MPMYPKFIALRNSLSTKCKSGAKYLYVQLRLVSLLDSPDITSSESFPVKLDLCFSDSDWPACNKFLDVKRTGRF